MTKAEREEREYKSLFNDERYAKKAWREIIGKSLESPAKSLSSVIDIKTGEETLQSKIDQMAYANVKSRLLAEGKDREPMQAELIVECNIIKARFTDSTFNIILDRTAGKVKEEVSVSSSPFEDLSDDELQALLAYRKSKEKEKSNGVK